jgi:hypothetical protein
VDSKRIHRFVRSLLVAGASLLIIVGAAFAGNAIAPTRDTTSVTGPAVADDPVDQAVDEDAPEVDAPEADEVDEVDKDEVDGDAGIPTAEEVADDNDAQGNDDDQGANEPKDAADQHDADEADEDDADETETEDADEDHGGGGESGDDSGEHDD